MDSYQTTDHEEIAIDSVEGLAALLEFANDLLLEINDLDKNADDDLRYREAHDQAEILFLKLQSLIEKHTKVLDLGGYLTTDDTDTIQKLYDELAGVRDSLDDAETPDSPQSEEHTPAPVAFATAKSITIPIVNAEPIINTVVTEPEEEEPEQPEEDEESEFDDEDSTLEETEEMSVTKQVSGSLQVRDESESLMATGVSPSSASVTC